MARLWAYLNEVPEDLDVEDSRMLTALRIGMPFAALVHALLLVFFLAMGQNVLAAYNVFSVLLLGAASRAVLRHGLKAMNFVVGSILVELPLHGLLTTLYLGLESLFITYVLMTLLSVGFVHLYSLLARLAMALYCSAMMVVTVSVGFSVEPWQAEGPALTAIMAVLNVIGAGAVIFLISATFAAAGQRAEARARAEYDRAEALLRNILPTEIAARLKAAPGRIADEYQEATILFADIVDFTESSARLSPTDLVDRLNRVFSAFDRLAAKHGVEKIKTIGDAYMVVAGLPAPRADHATVIVRMAQDMLTALDEINRDLGEPIRLRIGINTGPVVAGVIGESKFAYDLWGDAVNVAARLEEIAEPGQVRLGETTRAAIGEDFGIADLGISNLKGKGEVRSFGLALPVLPPD